MTQIRFRFRKPDASHVSGAPVEGVISCNPTMRVVQEDESLLLPVPFAVQLPPDGEDLTLDLKPTGADWCWRIAERINGLTHVRRVIVPDSTQTLDYATLSEAAWHDTSDNHGGLAHSIRTYPHAVQLGDMVDVDGLHPSDHVSVGDSVVDAEGHLWVISRFDGGKVTFGIDGGVSLRGPKGDKGEDGKPGADGKDGTGVNIKGSYGSPDDLNQAHPTGELGDAYIVAGALYVWSGSEWTNVGPIQGPQGPKGDKGEPGTNGKDGTNGVLLVKAEDEAEAITASASNPDALYYWEES